MRNALNTIGLVAVVTVLIWVWAEAESLSSVVMTPRVVFEAQAPDIAVRVLDPDWHEATRVRMEGSTVAIDTAGRLLASTLRLVPGVGRVPATPGEHMVDLREVIRNHPDFKRTGATLVEATPAAVTIQVTRLVTREIPVSVDLSGVEVEGDVTVTPPVVSVRMSEEMAERVDSEEIGGLAVLEAEERGRLQGEGPHTVRLRVRLPPSLADAERMTMNPDRVSVTFRVRKRVESLRLPTVPVWIQIPPTEGMRWDVEVLDPLLTDVTVTGPSDLIGRVQRREIVPVAQVILSSDELEARVEEKEAVFERLPSALEFSVDNPVVRLRITRREERGGDREDD